MLLIGSQALKLFFPERKCKFDTDYIATEEEYLQFVDNYNNTHDSKCKILIDEDDHKAIECVQEVITVSSDITFPKLKMENSNLEVTVEIDRRTEKKTVKHIYEFDIAKQYNSNHDILNLGVVEGSREHLELLYTIKMSHRYRRCSHRNVSTFVKTMNDILMMRKYVQDVPNHLKDIYAKRQSETYWYNHPSLKTSKNEFFKDDFYVYDHDSIHEAVKHLDQPAYRYYMKDGEEVQCDKSKWDALSEEVKLYGVLEEAYVLALERSQIPYPKTHRSVSFNVALMKVCTSITSGWFREYAWENYYKVKSLYNSNYVDRFYEALKSGIVKPFNGKKY